MRLKWYRRLTHDFNLVGISRTPLWCWPCAFVLTLPVPYALSFFYPIPVKTLFGHELSFSMLLLMIGTIFSVCMMITSTVLRSVLSSIKSPPASQLVIVLRTIFPKAAFDMVFSQAIIDFREEHSEMLAEGRAGRARWLAICLWGTLVLTAALWCATNVAKRIVSIWKLT